MLDHPILTVSNTERSLAFYEGIYRQLAQGLPDASSDPSRTRQVRSSDRV